jgi:hypothetical protein
LKQDVKITVSPENPEAGNFAQHLVLDATKIRRELRYEEQHTAEWHLLEMLYSQAVYQEGGQSWSRHI